jgi:hypothetical protein
LPVRLQATRDRGERLCCEGLLQPRDRAEVDEAQPHPVVVLSNATTDGETTDQAARVFGWGVLVDCADDAR